MKEFFTSALAYGRCYSAGTMQSRRRNSLPKMEIVSQRILTLFHIGTSVACHPKALFINFYH